MSDLIERLKRRGWTDSDIQKAEQIIQQGQNKKPKNVVFLDSIIYWLVLLVALIGNFIISIILIPFMLAIEGIRLIVIISVIGLAFGAFFDILIRDLKNIENKEIIMAGVFLPLLALINVSLMVNFANYIDEKLGLVTGKHNPFLISIVYVVAFVLPYLIRSVMDIIEKRNNPKLLNISQKPGMTA